MRCSPVRRRGGLMLIDGHLRAETTPDQVVPVLVLDVNEAEANKLLATLDPLAAMAETDMMAFKDLAGLIHTDSAEVRELLDGLAGFAREAQQDAIPALPVTPVARLGQIWRLGKHRLLCGDSTRPEDVSRLDGRGAGRAVPDRPALRDRLYRRVASGDEGESRQGEPQQGLVGLVPRGRASPDIEKQRDRPRFLPEVHQDRDRPGDRSERRLVLLAREHTPGDARGVWNEVGAFMHQQIIWFKSRPVLTYSIYMWAHEPCLFGWIKGEKPDVERNQEGGYPRHGLGSSERGGRNERASHLEAQSAVRDPDAVAHPCERPLLRAVQRQRLAADRGRAARAPLLRDRARTAIRGRGDHPVGETHRQESRTD